MCGIFGVIDPAGITANVPQRMSATLRHRGPDDEGFLYCRGREVEAVGGPDTPRDVFASGLGYAPAGTVAQRVTHPRMVLGHRRLSIIDLSPAGHQPMSFQDRYWIAFNGEVYNYLELREELRASGYHFRSGSDTEVILAAYDCWGADCLSRFNGMWGVAIFDQQQRKLFLARDRFGVKPLYYANTGGRFVFASEIKALVPLLPDGPTANLPRLLDFLVWNVSDHGEQTMLRDIVQLPPGHHLTLPLDQVLDGAAGTVTLNVKPQRWYTLQARADVSDREAAEALGDALRSAVSLRLRADVPVGSCLSGGLDSSAIVCVMSQLLSERGGSAGQKTFTACSDVAAFDESRYARAVVDATGVDATFVTPTAAALLDSLDDLIWHQDEPFNSTSIFAQWNVFQAARRAGIVVMLDGQGADESLGGYRGFFGAHLAGLMRQARLARWFEEASAIHREAGFGWVRILGYTAAYLQPGLLGWIGALDGRAYSDRRWIDPSAHAAFDADPLRNLGARASSIQQMSVAQLTATNLPMLLRWEDRNSMAASVEARVPFLDYRLVELALGLPDQAKVGAGISKRALRQAMRGTVPDQVLDRKDKMGFVTSEAQWLLHDEADATQALLAESAAALPGVVVPTTLQQDLAEMRAGARPYDHRIWRVLVAGRWIRRFGVRLG